MCKSKSLSHFTTESKIKNYYELFQLFEEYYLHSNLEIECLALSMSQSQLCRLKQG